MLAESVDEAMLYNKIDIAEMNEINTGAVESIEHAIKNYKKDIVYDINTAKAHIRDGKKAEAKKSLDAAMSKVKSARKEAEMIDDDGLLETIAINFILGIFGPLGAVASTVGLYYSWYTLRKQAGKGDTYSNRHPERSKNIVLEFFLGKIRGAGWSRSIILNSYDKLIDEIDRLKKSIDND